MMDFFRKIFFYLFYNGDTYVRRLPFSHVSKSSFVGKRARIICYLGEKKFNGSISIGNNSIFLGEFIFESDKGTVSIGDFCFINGGTKFVSRSKIIIGNNVTIAWNCFFYDHNSHSFDPENRKLDVIQQLNNLKNNQEMVLNKNWDSVATEEIHIKDNVWIGFDSVILSGVTIGEGAIVGARSVVRQNVEPWTMVAGNPAVVIGRRK